MWLIYNNVMWLYSLILLEADVSAQAPSKVL